MRKTLLALGSWPLAYSGTASAAGTTCTTSRLLSRGVNRMVNEQDLHELFDRAGFATTHEIQRTSEFKSRANGRYVYLNKDRLPHCLCLYIEDTLRDIMVPGTRVIGRRFRSNLRHFPRRMNNGKTPCHYGLAVEIDNSASLSDFLRWFNTN